MTDLFMIFRKEDLLHRPEREQKSLTKRRILSTAWFLLTAVLMWTFLRQACHTVGSIICASPDRALWQTLRMLPLYLTASAVCCLGASELLFATSAPSAGRLRRIGLITVSVGGFSALWVIVGLIAGGYEKLVENTVFPLYPLDMLIGGVLLALFGRTLLVRARANAGGGEKPAGRFSVLSFLGAVWEYGASACGVSAVCIGIFTLDFRVGFLYDLVLLLQYLMPVCMLIAYRRITEDFLPEKRKTALKGTALLFLTVNALLLILSFVGSAIEKETGGLNAYSILPIDYAANFGAFVILYGVGNMIPPAAVLAKTLIGKRDE